MSTVLTGGTWDPHEQPLYFLASAPEQLVIVRSVAKSLLVAVNELTTPDDLLALDEMLSGGGHVLLDSGIYSLAAAYAKDAGISHDEAIRTPLAIIPGYTALRARYCEIVRAYESRLWGYIELDLGGRDQKRATRTALEGEGLRPIPVYHPLNDGWDYFDELARRYDRICIGNTVHASRYVRLRLILTIWTRAQAYPGLWIHYLGLTPNEVNLALPSGSADSSSWLSAVRWNGYNERAALKPIGPLPKSAQYQLGDLETWQKGWMMGAFGAEANAMNWQHHTHTVSALGLDR